MSEDLTAGGGLQAFVHLASKNKGKALAGYIQQALSAPNVYVFGELLDMPNVQQLSETEDKGYFELLKIFAYGTYADYKASSTSLPQLTAQQLKKLRQLTVVSLSAQSRVIPYSILQQQLDITELRELEDVIIDAIYQGVIHGKLDQRSKTLEVEFTMGRDLKPDAVDNMITVLTNWVTQSESLLQTIKDKISHASYEFDQEKKHKEEFEKRVDVVKANLKTAMETEMMQGPDFARFL